MTTVVATPLDLETLAKTYLPPTKRRVVGVERVYRLYACRTAVNEGGIDIEHRTFATDALAVEWVKADDEWRRRCALPN